MKNKTILVVDDELPVRKLLNDKLIKEGFDVLLAKNGEEGLEMAITKKPDLIILDIVMPKIDGLTMLKKLREDQDSKECEVILLTNISGDENLSKAMEYGVYDYLVKSDWKIEDIINKIKAKLSLLA